MVFGQALPQVGVAIDLARLFDAGKGDLLDHDVRRHDDGGGDRTSAGAGVDQHDRAAIAVAEENWPLDAQSIEEVG